jgi:hypothetical protein
MANSTKENQAKPDASTWGGPFDSIGMRSRREFAKRRSGNRIKTRGTGISSSIWEVVILPLLQDTIYSS